MQDPHTAHAHAQPSVLASMRKDLADHREWVARCIVLSYAALAGASVVGFTWLSERALHGFMLLNREEPLAPFVWTPAVCALVVWITRRWFPGTAGSGIPQVIAALRPEVAPAQRGRFVSLRLAVAKIGLTAAGLVGGLAIGREGPAVQIAAGVMLHARRWLPQDVSIKPHGLLVAGGAAGIAAAFNAPLAGVMFAIEELTPRIEQRSSGLLVAAIVLAGLVAVSAFGNSTYFGVIRVPALHADFIGPAVLVAVLAGLLGGVFSRLLHASSAGGADVFSRCKARYPVRFAAGCGLAIACIGWASGGATFGSGYDFTRSLVAGQTALPLLYVTLRLVATWLAIWSGVPGGLFAPSLAIGAGLGSDVALLCAYDAAPPALIALGMAGFLAAITQAPITAFIIVMEMVDGHSMV
ncbi:MAG TPA: chloride channel protein, partial [Ramlibacter sp.]|uniref:chloride channel protein n=1 Tax=Ramlibacter sp. TaxID=1917967 RepID=UPI002CB5281F